MPFLRFHFHTVTSTNQAALELLDQNVPLPFVVQAEVQEAGQGRYGRSWYSPPGGLWITLALEPRPPLHFVRFTVLASEAVIRALEAVGIRGVQVKVPNDLQYRGYKVGGILGELTRLAALLGIGLNTRVQRFPKSLARRAGSLARLTGREIANAVLLPQLLEQLNRLDQEIARNAWLPWLQAWEHRLAYRGQRVRFRYLATGEVVEGIFEGVTPGFEILVQGQRYDLARIRDFRGVPEA